MKTIFITAGALDAMQEAISNLRPDDGEDVIELRFPEIATNQDTPAEGLEIRSVTTITVGDF